MSSPFRWNSPSPRSTPSRQINGVRKADSRRSSSRNSFGIDSPQKQILEEYARVFAQGEINFRRSLDEQSAAQQQRHIEALDKALARHAEVRQSAERARERADLEIEQERRRRLEEEQRAVEKARRDLEEQRLAQERRRLEEARLHEEARRRAIALQQEQEALRQTAENARRAEEEERAKRNAAAAAAATARAEADRKAQADEAARRQAQQAANQIQPPPKQPAVPTARVNGVNGNQAVAGFCNPALPPGVPSELVTAPNLLEATHKRYIELHKRLKTMREEVLRQCKQIDALKNQVSDWRRAIQKSVGQMSKAQSKESKDGNRKSLHEITLVLDQACQVTEPSIDITQYLVENQQPPNAATHGPAVLLFLLNYFSKYVIQQMTQESGVDGQTADPLGVMTVTIFARPNYLFNGQSLIDIFWAKYHKSCPVLFGVLGSETTQAGRLRIGWGINHDQGDFVQPKDHYDRMAGLGAGYAAITLRDFGKSKNANPAPNRLYWQAMARLLNTPKGQVLPTHLTILKAMIQNFVPRIIATFGSAGIALIRTACRSFPEERGPRTDKGTLVPSAGALLALPGALQVELRFTL